MKKIKIYDGIENLKFYILKTKHSFILLGSLWSQWYVFTALCWLDLEIKSSKRSPAASPSKRVRDYNSGTVDLTGLTMPESILSTRESYQQSFGEIKNVVV